MFDRTLMYVGALLKRLLDLGTCPGAQTPHCAANLHYKAMADSCRRSTPIALRQLLFFLTL